MTLLHQAALKAVEALKPCPFCEGAAAFVPRAVNLVLQKDPSDPKFGVSVICGKCGAESPNMVDEAHAAGAWNRRPESALQHQEEPREPVATLRVTLEYDDEDGPLEIVCHGTELNMRRLDARLKFLHRLEKQSNDCAASPSTTRQQEVGSGWKLVPETITEEMHVAAVRTAMRCSGNDDFPRRVWCAMLAAAPSTPEKAGGVSDGVDALGEGQR